MTARRDCRTEGVKMELDIKTLVFFYFIANALNNGLMFIIWRMYRKHYHGLSLLFADMCFQTVASVFFLLRGIIPDVLSIVATNLFSVLGLLFILKGLERFFNQRSRRVYNYAIIAVYILAIVYFSAVENNLFIRNLLLSGIIIVFNGQCAGLLLRKLSPEFRKIAQFTAFVSIAYCVANVLRIAALIIIPQHENDFFASGIVNSTAIIVYSALNILITAGLIMTVSQRVLLEVQTEKDKYTSAFHSSPYALLLTKVTDGKIFEVNEGFERMTGYRSEEVLGKTTLELEIWNDPAERDLLVRALLNGEDVREWETRFRVHDGRIMTALVSARQISAFGEDCILTSVSDITEMNKIKERLEKMALHDALTGLPNRQLFFDRAEVAIAHAKREQLKIAVISLDVDGLKFVNDHWGHMAGDRVLITLGARLRTLLRKVDTVSRFGGDEFLILLNGISRAEDARVIARRIMESVSEPVEVEGECIAVTASIGIALYPVDDTDMEALIRKSDEAMYHIKMHGRNGFRFYGENG